MALKIRQELKSVSECRRWMVVGNSFGGWVAAWMFLDESTAPTPGGAWLDRLVLVDSAGLRSSEDSRENSGAREWLRRGGVEALQEFQRRAYHSPRPLPASAWKAAAARLEASPTRKILEAQSPDERLDTFLPQIKRPTMVFWGASDRVTLPEAGRTFASLIPNARYQEAPSCGHLPQKECPKVLLKALNEHVMAGTL